MFTLDRGSSIFHLQTRRRKRTCYDGIRGLRRIQRQVRRSLGSEIWGTHGIGELD